MQWLGRAKEVSEFVKHGCDEATIEIELARNPNVIKKPGNIIVRRTMRREGNKSAFWVNGQASNMKQVSKLCQRLSIQVDNLCQFLPQEKVSEFARMDPVFLLHETQRAVCGPEMLEYHDNLKTLRKEQKAMRNEMKAAKEVLEGHQKTQERAQADVERIHERDAIQKRVKMLERCRPVARYHEAAAKAEKLKEARVAATTACDALRREVEPALRAVNAKQEYRKETELDAAKRKKQVEKYSRDANTRRDEISAFDDKQKVLEHDGEQLQKKQKARKEDEKRVLGNIKRIDAQMLHEPEPFDAASYNEKIVSSRPEILCVPDTNCDTACTRANHGRPQGSKR
jgi:chromosome segregation ATPase